MGFTRRRREPAPSGSERARSIAARGGVAALVATGLPGPTVPITHHVRADGSAALLIDDDDPILRVVEPDDCFPAMLEVTDQAPVDLRQPVRGVLWIIGWLWRPDPVTARRDAMVMADARPDPRLLDLGHGATILRLDPNTAVLSDGEGSMALAPVEMAAAAPDPFCHIERHWLCHLEHAHPDVLVALARHLPGPLRDLPDARVRPLGLDRCGIRLRVETPARDHDVRLAWQTPISTIAELRAAMHHLVNCPAHTAACRSTAS